MERLSAFRGSELYLLHEVVMRLDRVAQDLLKPLGLTYAEFLVLLQIVEQPGTRHHDVAQRMNLSKTSVSLRVKTLLERNWIVQRQNPRNRREQLLEPTPAGREVLDQAVRTLADAAEPLFAQLGEARQGLKLALARLQHNLQTPPTRST